MKIKKTKIGFFFVRFEKEKKKEDKLNTNQM
jgi:hypothetical protein